MNAEHLRICASPEWAETVRDRLIPWVTAGQDLGNEVLEIGAGPGLTTDVLRSLVPRLTALELDHALAAALAGRLNGTNVTVLEGDATAMPLDDGTFSAVTSLTMLHHVPTADLQDAVLAEARRVLRPGGLFFGADGTDTPERRALHEDDIFNPIDPEALPERLSRAGFIDVRVDVNEDRFRFRARTPEPPA